MRRNSWASHEAGVIATAIFAAIDKAIGPK
jgi:hypothetical protein